MQQSNSQQYILALIEELKLPIPPDEAKAHIENLSEEEIQELLPSFEYVKSYQKTLSEEAQSADPDRYALIEATFQKEVRELHEHFLNKIETIQEKYDTEMDALETEESKEIDEIVEKQKEELGFLEAAYYNLQQTIASKAE